MNTQPTDIVTLTAANAALRGQVEQLEESMNALQNHVSEISETIEEKFVMASIAMAVHQQVLESVMTVAETDYPEVFKAVNDEVAESLVKNEGLRTLFDKAQELAFSKAEKESAAAGQSVEDMIQMFMEADDSDDDGYGASSDGDYEAISEHLEKLFNDLFSQSLVEEDQEETFEEMMKKTEGENPTHFLVTMPPITPDITRENSPLLFSALEDVVLDAHSADIIGEAERDYLQKAVWGRADSSEVHLMNVSSREVSDILQESVDPAIEIMTEEGSAGCAFFLPLDDEDVDARDIIIQFVGAVLLAVTRLHIARGENFAVFSR